MMIYQAQRRGCGYAAVKMALVHASKQKRFAYAPEPLIEKKAPSLADLIRYASSFHLSLSAYKVRDGWRLLHDERCPMLLVLKEDSFQHMVYFSGRVGHYCKILDPARGVRWLKEKELLAKFQGSFLCINGYDGGREVPYRPPRPIRAVPRLLFLFFPLILTLCLLLGLSLLNGPNPYLSLPFFVGCLIAEAGKRICFHISMQQFDREYVEGIDDPDPERRKERFVHFHSYKKAAFAGMPNLWSSLLEVGVLTFLIGQNDLYLCLALAGLFASLSLDWAFIQPLLRDKEEEIEHKEGLYMNIDIAQGQRKSLLKGIFSSSYRLSFLYSLRLLLFVLLCLGLTFFALSFGGGFGLPVFLFSFALLLYAGKAVEDSFKTASLLELRKKEEPYFQLHFQSGKP